MCGGSDPVSAVTNPISNVLGTDGSGGGVLGALDDAGNWIDQNITQPVGGALAEADTFVNRELPGGWTLPAVIALAYMTGGGSLAAEGAMEGATAVESATAAGESAYADAILNGATEEMATQAGNEAAQLAYMDAVQGPIGVADIPAADAAASANSIPDFSQYGNILGNSVDESGNVVQVFDDGSTMTTDINGNVISTTEATEPFTLPDGTVDAAKSLAKNAASRLMSRAASNLMTGKGVKSGLNLLGGTGTLGTGTDQNITASTSQDSTNLTPDIVKGNPNFTLNDFVNIAPNAPQTFTAPTNPAISSNASQAYAPLSSVPTQSFRAGGDVEGHNPTFFSPGGLASMENTYVKGEGDGTSDSVAAMLADGEFVIPADVVSKLGNGSNDAGAEVLDEFLTTIRAHAQKHDPKELPPDSKGPLAYLAEAKKKASA